MDYVTAVELLSTGGALTILAVVCVTLFGVVVYLFKLLIQSNREQIEFHKEERDLTRDVIAENNSTKKELTRAISSLEGTLSQRMDNIINNKK